MFTIEMLDTKHPSFDPETWADLYALYKGGKLFRARIERFLNKNPAEPTELFHHRKAEASYTSYLGPIIDHYSAWLFAGDFEVRAKEGDSDGTVDPKPEYARLREDVGGGIDMKAFVKERFTKSLVEGRSHWLCVMPGTRGLQKWPDSLEEYEAAGLKKAHLEKVDAADLHDWEVDEKTGKLNFCILHSLKKVRESIQKFKRVNVETWTVYDQEFVTEYRIVYADNERPPKETPLPPHAQWKHGFNVVPLVTLHMPDGLHIADRVFDPQRAHFRLTSALDWSIKRTCYAMPVLNLESDEKPPVMGTGHWIMLGLNEKFSWAAPPDGQFAVISKQVDAQRDNVYRATHEMAQGLDNNAETVGRSADSKEVDTAATRIMLNAYGSIVAQAIEECYEIISDAFGDTHVSWSIEGLSGYDVATAPQVIGNAMNAQLVNIPSKQFHIESKKKVVKAMLPEISQEVMDLIVQQITENVSNETDLLNMSSAANAQSTKEAELTAKTTLAASAQKAAAGGGSSPSKPAGSRKPKAAGSKK